MQKRSIVKKQMLLYTGTVTVCVFLLGVVLALVYSQYYMNEKREELIEQCRKISDALEGTYLTENLGNLSYELQVLEEYMNAGVMLVNRDGVVAMTSPGLKRELIGKTIEENALVEGLLGGNIVSTVAEDNPWFDEAMLIVGYPMNLGHLSGLFMCRPMPEIERSIAGIYHTTIISMFCVFAVAAVISTISYRRLINPVLAMNRAARVIANGDFEQRVEVYGDDEMGQLAKSFNYMAESLQNNDKNRRDFIANVSHDLRSPLTSMQGFLTAMIDGTVPPQKQEKYLKIVLEETYRLSRLTEGIVDLSRAENSRILLDETDFDLNELLRDTISVMEPQLNEKEIIIKAIYDESATIVHADRDKISRVVENLISNAIKFSPNESVIEVETTITERRKILVAVKDYGMGIEEEDQKYIFNRFYKADSTRNQDKIGSGIGLSIVREFIHAHGEAVTVKSEVGRGSTFVFTLKLAKQ